MNDRLIPKTAAFVLALAVTLSLLVGMDSLAVEQHAAATVAQAATPATVHGAVACKRG